MFLLMHLFVLKLILLSQHRDKNWDKSIGIIRTVNMERVRFRNPHLLSWKFCIMYCVMAHICIIKIGRYSDLLYYAKMKNLSTI